MTGTPSKSIPDETRLCALLLHKRVLSEGQLKAALDYQRSLGGRLFDVLVKLNLIREQSMEELLARIDRDGDAAGSAVPEENVVAPSSVKVADLKVHRKLVEKLPAEFVAQYLLVLFFPSANVNQRKIILGHGRDIGAEVREKVKTILGVDVSSLALDPEVARAILKEVAGGEAARRSSAQGRSPAEQLLPARPGSFRAVPVDRQRADAPSPEARTSPETRATSEPRPISDARPPLEPKSPLEPRPIPDSKPVLDSRPMQEPRSVLEPKVSPDPRPSASPFPARPSAPDAAEPPMAAERIHSRPSMTGEMLLHALVALLIKKGIFTPDEVEVELELLRLRRKSKGV